MRTIYAIGALCLLGAVAAVLVVPSAPPPSTSRQAPSLALERCLDAGVAYFQGVGSWPRLADGTNAVDEARRRCRLNHKAFG